MKKILLSALLSLGIVFVVPMAASADSASTIVSGTVKSGNTELSGADVTVSCDNLTQTDSTDATGGYLVSFAAVNCPAGSTVHAFAMKGAASGTGSGKASMVGGTKLNVAVADVNVALPEMGTIAGGVAALGAGAAFLVIRRKQQFELS